MASEMRPAGAAPASAPAPPTVTYISFSAEIVPHTTEALLAVCADLANKRVPTVYLMLSTPGGSVMHGLTIYNFLRSMPYKVITHNVGNVDSIGNVVFLAGEERYSSAHATFMFHGVGFDVMTPTRFDERFLRERLESILADQRRIGGIFTERAGIPPEEVGRMFLEAATRDPAYAKNVGIVHDIREVKVPDGAPVLQLIFKR